MGRKKSGLVGRNDLVDRVADPLASGHQRSNYVLTSEGLTLREAYRMGKLDLCFVYIDSGATQSSRLIRTTVRSVEVLAGPAVLGGDPAGQRLIELVGRSHDGSMLVDIIEFMDSPEDWVPIRASIESFDYTEDLFSGEIYLSATQGVVKSLIVHRFPGEGILDVGIVSDLRGQHHPNGVIQSGSEIVGSISDDHGKPAWDGFLVMDAHARVWAGLLENDLDRLAAQIGCYPPVQVVDVIFGPLNLSQRSGKR